MAYTNEQTERRQLHKELIDEQDLPCSKCSSRDRREIHRITPGHDGGKYTRDNVEVLCFPCHRNEHLNSKFRIGDSVMINGRTPYYIDLPRHRPRTIIAVRYDTNKECNFYLVGSNCSGANTGNGNPLNGFNDYWFRSYQLVAYQPRRYHFIRHRQATKSKNSDSISLNTRQAVKGIRNQSREIVSKQG